jgi:thioredoxin-related protein
MSGKVFTVLIFSALSLNYFSQNENNGLVKWLTIKEAQEKNKTLQKPIILDIYTDWCGWCKHMMKTTYSNPGLADYINTNFYPVKFNAETKDTIEYDGKIYKPLSKEPKTTHELAIKFLGEKLSYPSTMFIANNFQFNLLSQGFLEDKKIEPILVFMVENAWQTSAFEEFNKHFLQTFVDTNYTKIAVPLIDIKDLEKVQNKKPKKTLVCISADFCNTGKVMNKTSFTDTCIGNLINKNFNLVQLNAANKDTIVFKNEKHYNTIINNFPFNTLAFKLTNNRLTLPSLCVLDEELNLIDVLNFYQSPEKLKPILTYFASNSYKDKTKTFNDFMQTEYLKGAVKQKK